MKASQYLNSKIYILITQSFKMKICLITLTILITDLVIAEKKEELKIEVLNKGSNCQVKSEKKDTVWV